MKNHIVVLVLAFGVLLGAPTRDVHTNSQITMTVLYDNSAVVEGTKSDWGFSCVIKGAGETILFDTGTQSDVLIHNSQKLDISLDDIDRVVVSHNHGDHTGGLDAVMERNPGVSVYFPASFPEAFAANVSAKKAIPIRVDDPREICENVYVTGEMGDTIREQSLILNTKDGLVIITGCSHQGIVSILARAKEMFDKEISLVFGGFHLLRHSNDQIEDIIRDFRALGVRQCGATHCSGDEAIALLKRAYGNDFVPMGVGRVVQVSH
jgi:7,8-dihydropterin-6-yl-methyl-4-(beta-D-ribofuranosyl)aminobenzene 5'-phosphate synthase